MYRVYLPPGLPEPASREYTAHVLEAALPLIEAAGGRCFLLFTSHRALTEGARLLEMRPGFRERYPVLVQGESPRESLLAQFRELGNAVRDHEGLVPVLLPLGDGLLVAKKEWAPEAD